MDAILAIDTSNYTTSCALLFNDGSVKQCKRLLPVKEGSLGLRQSDAVFLHTKNLSTLIKELVENTKINLKAVGVSITPRNQEGSYMPCFLVGKNVAESIAAINKVPLFTFSHQQGHIAAVLYGSNRLDIIDKEFLAYHFSGGTTECVSVKDLLDGKIDIISATADINAGQLIDRAGVMLKLPFPSGKYLEELAEKSTEKFNIKSSFPNLSGYENKIIKMYEDKVKDEDIAFYVENVIYSFCHQMANEALKKTDIKEMVFSGGVMSNKYISSRLKNDFNGIFAPGEFSSDNSVGLAVLANAKLHKC